MQLEGAPSLEAPPNLILPSFELSPFLSWEEGTQDILTLERGGKQNKRTNKVLFSTWTLREIVQDASNSSLILLWAQPSSRELHGHSWGCWDNLPRDRCGCWSHTLAGSTLLKSSLQGHGWHGSSWAEYRVLPTSPWMSGGLELLWRTAPHWALPCMMFPT